MVDVKLSLECVLRPHLNALTSYVSDMQRYWLSCTWVIKGIKLWCPHPTLKIMCLPQSLLDTKVRALNNALIATTKKKKKKWIHCQVSSMAVLLRIHKGWISSDWHKKKTVCRFSCEGKKMKGNWVQTAFQTFILFSLLRSVRTLESELRPPVCRRNRSRWCKYSSQEWEYKFHP